MRPTNSIDRSVVKKKQSSLKSLVQSFGKLILSWKNDNHEIMKLFQCLDEIESTISSVKNTTSIDELSYLSTSVEIFYPFIGPKLISKLLIDRESIFTQLRNFL